MRSITLLLIVLAPLATGCLNRVGNGPVVVVTTSYPGANAQMVADVIAAPIEQQINGVESMVRLESESRNDGNFIAYVSFKPNTDPNLALVLVQNRVSLAMPALPEAVQRAGVTVNIRAAEQNKKGVTIAIVDRGSRGRDALRRFSEAALKQLSADGAIMDPKVFPGPDEKQVSVQVDRAKCAKYGVTLAAVIEAMQGAGLGGKIADLKALHVRSNDGKTIPLGELATIELVDGPAGVYRVDMYPAVRITGSPPKGKTAESAASTCAELADAERKNQDHPDDFSVVNLTSQ
jgi:multidrug efflux pump subunit AcrB